MVTPTPQHEQGRLRCHLAVDLTSGRASLIAAELAALSAGRLRGQHVTVRVGRLEPRDVDERAPQLLGDALAGGVDVTLDGEPLAVDAWRFAINEARTPLRPWSGLQLVKW